jgi:hypothetical protein
MLADFFVKNPFNGDSIKLKALIQIRPELLTLNFGAFNKVASSYN